MKFDETKLPDLDEIVIDALNLFISNKLPKLSLGRFERALVIGSGNAAVTGRILFDDKDAVFADEGNFKHKLDTIKDINLGILISASGEKHAPLIAKELKRRKIKSILLTNNEEASARELVTKSFIFPKNTEPYTYNASTYLGMILSKTRENPKKILRHIKKIKRKIPKDFKKYDAFYIIVPKHLYLCREMFLTKFDELFGPKISSRVFTIEQTKHAKTIVPSKKELFIYLGCDSEKFGDHKHHLHVKLTRRADYGEIILAGYYIIGHIQKQNPAWFKEHIYSYTKKASKLFGQEIKPIVD